MLDISLRPMLPACADWVTLMSKWVLINSTKEFWEFSSFIWGMRSSNRFPGHTAQFVRTNLVTDAIITHRRYFRRHRFTRETNLQFNVFCRTVLFDKAQRDNYHLRTFKEHRQSLRNVILQHNNIDNDNVSQRLSMLFESANTGGMPTCECSQ